MLIVVVLLSTVVLRLAIVAWVIYRLLPRGPLCPRCEVEMVPIRNRFFDRFLRIVQRRWCLECGWNGIVRRIRTAPLRSRSPRRTPRATPQ